MPAKIIYNYETFTTLSNTKYNSKFEYVKFEGELTSKSEFQYICPIHGEITSKVYLHLKKANETGCTDCGRLLAKKNASKGIEQFAKDLLNLSGDKYDLSKFKYVNNKTHGILICNDCHNEWSVRPDNVLAGHNCPSCTVKSIYTTQYYESHSIPDHECNLYLVKFKDLETNEEFLKIGISKYSVAKRFRGLHSKFEITVLKFKSMMFFEAFKIEQTVMQEFKQSKFQPSQAFSGHTECIQISSENQLQSYLSVMID